jgi:hypothetical protein
MTWSCFIAPSINSRVLKMISGNPSISIFQLAAGMNWAKLIRSSQ